MQLVTQTETSFLNLESITRKPKKKKKKKEKKKKPLSQ